MNFQGKIILAPMAGVTDAVFRRLCRQNGADIVVSEMVSADGLWHGSENTAGLTKFDKVERPLGIQLFGADAERLGWAARRICELASPDFVDLNAGCPVRKVVRRNGGAALMCDSTLFGNILEAMVRNCPVPVTVKIRSGWHTGVWIDTELAKIAEQSGVAALTLHARSAVMMYSGRAYWERIALVKQSVRIPIIGNGDVDTPQAAVNMLRQTGCDSVMIGRGAMGNPWIFKQARAAIEGREIPEISQYERIAMAMEHLRQFRSRFGERCTVAEMKRHIGWYLKGLQGAATARTAVFRSTASSQMEEILDRFGRA